MHAKCLRCHQVKLVLRAEIKLLVPDATTTMFRCTFPRPPSLHSCTSIARPDPVMPPRNPAETEPNIPAGIHHPASLMPDDIANTQEVAAARQHLEAETASTTSSDPSEWTIVHTGSQRPRKKVLTADDDEPLIDTTAALAKNSKKTKRLQKQQHRRKAKAAARARPESFLDLPAELLQEILGYLRPSDVYRVQLLNQATRDFILQHERSITRDILDRRYWVLRQCFPLPCHFDELDEPTKRALLNPRRERATEIHKKPYQHIKSLDPQKICSCPSCLLAWNNLNIVLDFAHFQKNLDHREPIPMIPRGTQPEWNVQLIESHAQIVERAMSSPLCYAAILQKHLASISGTILRQVRFPPHMPKHRHTKMIFAKTVHPNRLYRVTEKDAEDETDEFLERDGRPSFEIPFHRDNYYSLLAYVPNRKWDKEQHKWMYYGGLGHERDLEWTRRWYLPKPEQSGGQEAFIAAFRAATT